MMVLALESAGGSAGVALAGDEGVVAEATVHTSRRHVELLHPLVAEVLLLAGASVADLDAVAADVGPGLFTGIRVGVSAAKAIAMARALPAVGVTSLQAIEAAARDAGAGGVVVPVVDLRRGEVAWSLSGEVAFGPAARLAAALGATGEAGVLVGGGALRYADELGRGGWEVAGPSLSSAPVASVAVLAHAAVSKGATLDPARLVPCYLREADARINWTTRHDGSRKGG